MTDIIVTHGTVKYPLLSRVYVSHMVPYFIVGACPRTLLITLNAT